MDDLAETSSALIGLLIILRHAPRVFPHSLIRQVIRALDSYQHIRDWPTKSSVSDYLKIDN